MVPDEKRQLLTLLADGQSWCQGGEARDAEGLPVSYDDQAAVAWDITGALCRLFGWRRACVLFPQLERHILGKTLRPAWPERDTSLDAMLALQTYNDDGEITFEELREQIETMPVWYGGQRAGAAT